MTFYLTINFKKSKIIISDITGSDYHLRDFRDTCAP